MSDTRDTEPPDTEPSLRQLIMEVRFTREQNRLVLEHSNSTMAQNQRILDALAELRGLVQDMRDNDRRVHTRLNSHQDQLHDHGDRISRLEADRPSLNGAGE